MSLDPQLAGRLRDLEQRRPRIVHPARPKPAVGRALYACVDCGRQSEHAPHDATPWCHSKAMMLRFVSWDDPE